MKFKRFLTTMLFVSVLLMASAAMAANIKDLDADLFNVILPDGLVLRNENPKTEGHLTLNVDTDATVWPAVLAAGHGNYAQMIYQFLVPTITNGDPIGTGDAFIMFFEDPEMEPEEMFANIEQHPAAYYVINGINSDGVAMGETSAYAWGMTENTVTLGQHLPVNGYLSPETMQDTRYICWYRQDAAGTWQPLTPYYRLQISLTQTLETAFPMNGAKPVPADKISASITQGQADVNYSRTAVVEDGKVTFTIAVGDTAETIIDLPDGASWRAPSLKGYPDSGSGDISVSKKLSAAEPVLASTKTYMIFTQDENGRDVTETWSITFYYQTDETNAWPYYLPDDFTRLTVGSGTAADRLIIRNGAAEAGYRVQFDNSAARILSDFNGEVTNSIALTGEVEVSVTPPEGALSFRYTHESTNGGILGRRYADASTFDNELENSWFGTESNPNLVNVHDRPGYSYPALRKIIPADVPNLAIYVPSIPTTPNHANLLVINWYKDLAGEELLQRDFVWETITPNEKPVYGQVVETEAELQNKPVKIPCVIGPGSQQAWKGNWKLLVKTYYQEGINARHYEFHLVDKDNNPVVLPVGEKVTVYLPIPEEMEGAVPSETTFRLQHYSSKFYDENDPDLEGTPVQVTMTEYGLKMEVDSFSPFILSWDAGEENPNATASQTAPPQTGDATPVWLLGALCLCSLAALAIAKRRKQA